MKYNRDIDKIIIPILLLIVFVGIPFPSNAQTESDSTDDTNTITLTLEDLGFSDQTYFSPGAFASYIFDLPSEWDLISPLEINLDIETILTVDGNGDTYNGILEFEYNTTQLELTVLNLSNVSIVNQVIDEDNIEALESQLTSGEHHLVLNLITDFECSSNQQVAMVVDADSTITFTYLLGDLELSLVDLPVPFYETAFSDRQTTIVLPVNPSEQELQALLSTVAAFGRSTNGNMVYDIITLDLLDNQIQENNHLIFVGQLDEFESVEGLQFNISDSMDEFNVMPDDGLLELVVSPWNNSNAVLLVSGLTDTGTAKAAQSLGYETIRTSDNENRISVISEVNSDTFVTEEVLIVGQSFLNSGVETRTVNNIGTRSIAYDFFIDMQDYPLNDYSLIIQFRHSALLDYDLSVADIEVNDTLIGTIRFEDATSNGGVIELDIPSSALTGGINRLEIVATLQALDPCISTGQSNVWFAVDGDSSLIQSTGTSGESVIRSFDLSDYPAPFVSDADLSTTAFVLSENDIEAWRVAADMIYEIGRNSAPTGFAPLVVFGDDVNATIVENNHLIIVGQPAQIPYIAELGDYPPAQFEPDSNYPIENNFNIAYRVSPDKQLGYLQMIISEGTNDRFTLMVLGTDAQALQNSVSFLIDPRRSRFRNGTVQLIEGDEIISIGRDVGGLIIPNTGVANTTTLSPDGSSEVNAYEVSAINFAQAEFEPPRPLWILDVLLYSSVAVVTILLIVILSRLWKWIRNR